MKPDEVFATCAPEEGRSLHSLKPLALWHDDNDDNDDDDDDDDDDGRDHVEADLCSLLTVMLLFMFVL